MRYNFTLLYAFYNYTEEAIAAGRMCSMITLGNFGTFDEAKQELKKRIKADAKLREIDMIQSCIVDGSYKAVYNDDMEAYYTIVQRHELTEEDLDL